MFSSMLPLRETIKLKKKIELLKVFFKKSSLKVFFLGFVCEENKGVEITLINSLCITIF